MNGKSTLQPFEAGDIFIGCTVLNDDGDDHAGDGRIVQYDANMEQKGELWTVGGAHLVGGLEFDPNGILWAFDDLAVIHVDPQSRQQLPLAESFLPRVYRSASFDRRGHAYLGEHLNCETMPEAAAKLTSIKFPVIPDKGVHGLGNIYEYDAQWNLVQVFDVENCPEMTGFKGVTHSSLHPSGEFITYTTETGKRIMRYDVINNQQMPDLLKLPGDDVRDGNMVIAVKYLPDGRLLVTRGDFFEVLDEEGQVLESFPLEGFGWTDFDICHTPGHILISNIWNGLFIKFDLNTGQVIGRQFCGQEAPKRSLAGIAEFSG